MPTLKKITCLAVDDEPPALDVLENHIRCVPALTLVGTCNNALEAMEKLQIQPVNLIFLDIQMPQILGTDFIRTLKNPPKIIFTTAYRKFAIEGFELNAVDYLLKPISFERFLRAVNKVMDTSLVPADNAGSEPAKEHSPEFLYFRSNRKMVKVSVNEVLYIESLKDYIKVITPTKTIIAKQSMTSLEGSLPRENFIRIHRSFIIALNKIESFNSEMVELGKKELPIGRFYKHEVDKVLNVDKR
jgi:DNA-binding LytR/AlgR family response regulator